MESQMFIESWLIQYSELKIVVHGRLQGLHILFPELIYIGCLGEAALGDLPRTNENSTDRPVPTPHASR